MSIEESNMAALLSTTSTEFNQILLKFIDPWPFLRSVINSIKEDVSNDDGKLSKEKVRLSNLALEYVLNLDRPIEDFEHVNKNMLAEVYTLYFKLVTSKSCFSEFKHDLSFYSDMTDMLIKLALTESKINDCLNSIFSDLASKLTSFCDTCAKKLINNECSLIDLTDLDHLFQLSYSVLKNEELTNSSNVSEDYYCFEKAVLKCLCFLNHLSDNQSSYILYKMIPVMKKYNENIYKDIYKDVCAKSVNNSINLLNQLYLLCFIEQNLESELIYDNIAFKTFIQLGYIDDNPACRKLSLYLTYKFISRNCDSDVQNFWETYCLIIECLAEKQFHLIEPIYPKIEKLAAQSLNINVDSVESWILLIFKLILKHDNNLVYVWGMKKFFEVYSKEIWWHSDIVEKFLYEFILPSFNNNLLFDGSNIKKAGHSTTFDSLTKYFMNATRAYNEQEKCCLFFSSILNEISEIKWQTTPLFYMLCSLYEGSPCNFNESSLSSFCATIKKMNFVDKKIEVMIKTLFIKIVIKRFHCDFVSPELTVEILGLFRSFESSEKRLILWKDYCNIIQENILVDSNNRLIYQEFCMKNFRMILAPSPDIFVSHSTKENVYKIVRLIILLFDAKVLSMSQNTTQSLFTMMRDNFDDMDSRSYLSPKLRLLYLYILSNFLEELKHHEVNSDNSKRILLEYFKQLSTKSFSNIIRLISISSEAITETDSDVIFCISLMSKLINFSNQYKVVMIENCVSYMEIWIKSILHCMSKSSSNDLNPSKVMHSIQIFAWFCKQLPKNSVVFKHSIFLKVLQNIEKLFACFRTTDCFTGHQRTTLYLCTWQIIYSFVQKASDWDSILDLDEIIEVAVNSLQEVSGEACVVVVDFITIVVEKVNLDSVRIVNCLQATWSSAMEHKRNEYFQVLLKKFINLLYQSKLLDILDSDLFSDFGNELLEIAENSNGLCLYLIDHICNLYETTNYLSVKPVITNVIVKALLYGPFHKKDHKVYLNTFNYYHDNILKSKSWLKTFNENKYVRSQAIKLILKICIKDTSGAFVKALTQKLIDEDECLIHKKKRYYANSMSHRVKNRIWQSLLCIQFLWDEEMATRMLDIICNNLMSDNQQTSVKYLLQWSAMLLLIKYPQMTEKFYTAMKEAGKKRVASIASFMTIVNHVILFNKDESIIKKLIQFWIPNILHWCLSQNFISRIFSLAVIQNIHKKCIDNGFDDIINSYKAIFSSMQIDDDCGNTAKNMEKLLTDFFFSKFNPVNHYSIQTILYELPRLSHLSEEEWISMKFFDFECDINFENSTLSKYNTDDLLKDSHPSSWNAKNTDYDVLSMEPSENVQKKIMPWKLKIMNSELFSSSSSGRNLVISSEKAGLIVVASLIDKVPNLGGLCRTSEIFGVNEFVIDNKNIIESKDFTSLSVSADRWIPIKEVKKYNLAEYLLQKKQEGFLVVGAEQSVNSISLNNAEFPKKTVILLGNEKEGIPANLIKLLDVCIEIPQHGIIRSLNVHVSGALLIWEYSKQYH